MQEGPYIACKHCGSDQLEGGHGVEHHPDVLAVRDSLRCGECGRVDVYTLPPPLPTDALRGGGR